MAEAGPVPPVPPPWHLEGDGYIFAFRFEADALVAAGALPGEDGESRPAGVAGAFEGGFSVAMLVDYRVSPVGPYKELLFIPGRFRHRGESLYSISRIYVSTRESVLHGRRNWGIPKELAEFSWERLGRGEERVSVTSRGALVVQLHLASSGLPLPFTTSLLPASQRTLWQSLEGQTFRTLLAGRGRLKRARLLDAHVGDGTFAPLSREHIVAGFRAQGFHLTFPKAEVGPLEAPSRASG